MTEFVGQSGDLLFFTSEDKGVIIDSSVSMIVASGNADTLVSSADWNTEASAPAELHELANTSFAAAIVAAAGRLYTIPKAAQAEAKKALEWRKEEGRGGTDVGLNTARTLAKGGQIGLKKVRHIAKYFPRHEVDKQGKGWKPAEDGFPSNGRIAWALWGGDAAWRWASAIVEREDKAMTAAGFASDSDVFVDGVDISEFETAYEAEAMTGPEFLARVRMDGSGMDRLYKIDADASVFVWDEGQWDDMGLANQDIWSYDAELDAAYEKDFVETTHSVIDPESAVFLAARLYEIPRVPVTIEELDAHEATLAADALADIDWEFIDRTLIAAGTEVDGVYTEEERSANASEQVRDATGRFAKTGTRVVINGDFNAGAGQITKINPANKTVTVKLDSGESVEVLGSTVQDEGDYDTTIPDTPLIDTSGILGEPRTPVNSTVAQIPGTLPAMRQADLQQVISDWPAYVQSQRESFKAGESLQRVKVQNKNSTSLGERGEAFERAVGKSLTTDAYEHPLLKDWLYKSDRNGVANKLWYNPITAAAESKVVKEIVPQTSDVQPIYMAIVDSEDPRAVTALISLVPANDKSTAPMTYSRKDGKWVRDPATLADLNSATPPPVVPLDSKTLNDVLIQVDATQGVTASIALTVLFGNDPIVAAGGVDRNRGNAEELRRYWTRGAGAAKIRWGQGGDWKRCVRLLSKHMGVRAKGYCQLRHKDALGYYTSTHAKMDRAKTNSIATPGEDDDLSVVEFTEVTREDMQTPIRVIMEEEDDLYDGEWEPDTKIVDIMSDEDALEDGELALVSAGGPDRNRGKAEELRKYWTVGKGGAKIRWGTGGDWTRCYRNLAKYMGPRAKGYCALRHKEMNGMWPGEQSNQFVTNQSGSPVYTSEVLRSEEEILELSALAIKTQHLKARVAGGMMSYDDDSNVEVQTFFFHDKVDMPVMAEKLLEGVEPVDEQEIAIEDLIPSQNTVNTRRIQAIMDSQKPVKVLITEDGPVLIDGHHRTVARMLSGYNTVPAKIYKIEEGE